ncbi:ORF6N domain-containing protein [Pseudobutyrivibrio ruminis]|uniref:ORF6N domain-containing protein n=1 Tax=Pseudobutyrivibrio ruminis TaxID=46206 RepID=A0A1H7EVS0_9FIRM|nr:ORF6N domain-containing protein [Pseudobutyrivibrio ruminis]MBE5914332.1 ORF6N domain-containing protein [Pseudobutyrivibrio ruminis]SEK17714.1 ORF6N domain-containing protein [Pseudobutyrivibrio ruminis]
MAGKKKEDLLPDLSNNIFIISEETIRERTYIVRNQKVMLDFDLAEIYGYETKNLNRQVKNNIKKFLGEDFMFELTDEEVEELSRCKNFTLKDEENGRGKNIKYNPHAFTEQGIYMLMTVLRGELAIKQSRALVRTFKKMKDYIVSNEMLPSNRQMLQLSMQVTNTTQSIAEIKKSLNQVEDDIAIAMGELSDVVRKSELAEIFENFSEANACRGYLFFNGQIFDSDVAYAEIYLQASSSIYVVDNYISTKTLQLLTHARDGVEIKIYSDNLMKGLSATEYTDFRKQYSELKIELYESGGVFHDRYIILDYGTDNMKIYLCGSSSKDSGARITTILEDQDIEKYKNLLEILKGNGKLKL